MHSQKDRHQEQIQQMRWIIRLRWIAVAGIIATASLWHLLKPYDLTAIIVAATVVAGYNRLAQLHSQTFQVRGPLVWPGEAAQEPGP